MPDAYLAGLTMLARRELSEMQLRTRLARRGFDADDIDEAVARLKGERALDDARVATACARTEAGLRRRGRARVLRQVEALGIAREIARRAVADVFAEVDEARLLEESIARRLRRGISLEDEAAVRRLHRYLIGQGFEPSRVAAALRSKVGAPGRQSRIE